MKITHTLLASVSIIAAFTTQASAASSAMTLRNLDNANLFLDSGGVALDSGTPNTVNGNGTLAQLGYFSTNTSTFEGTWNVVAEFNIGDFYLQSGSTPVDDGKFLAKASFDENSLGLPSSDAQMAIRFYEGTNAATDKYNTVTHSAWKFLTPSGPPDPTDRDFDVNDNSDTLAWESTSLGITGGEFKTVIAVPEPSSFALLGLGATAMLFRRRK